MSQTAAVALGAIAGGTIFLGLPVARIHGLPRAVQGFLNAFATGILVFLLWDILTHAGEPVEAALEPGQGSFPALAAIFAASLALGLLGLVYFNRTVFSHLRHGTAAPTARSLSLAIATGLGLHNISEGFGIAAPMTTEAKPPSWGFLGLAGLIGGGPTFIGTWIGYLAGSTYFSVAFLAMAAGALIYVLNELFNLGRRISTPPMFAWGVLGGFLTAFGTDLFLVSTGA